ncbi:MAG: membrane protein insertion efficiency factor YidD [Nitratireductor sp.]|nr:membrane protein insertion efficiency factor YidD [Nitratireductor sp.]
MQYIIFIIILYSFILFLTFIVRWRQLNVAARALIDNEHQQAVSLMWAWSSMDGIRSSIHRWGEGRFGPILLEPNPRFGAVLNPLKLAVIFLVVVYQAVFRGVPLAQAGSCPNTPNCSNYLIGCVTRYGLLHALSKGYIRYQQCSGPHPPSYHERF